MDYTALFLRQSNYNIPSMNSTLLPQPLPHGSLWQRLFARADSHSASIYDESIFRLKRTLFSELHGRILEIGPGTGPNIRFFSPDIEWLGVEPNPFMYPYLVQSIRTLGRPEKNFRILPGDPCGVRLPVENESMDAVVCTQVLCSVADPEATLQEVRRVLKPGGRFAFLEHVAASRGSGLRLLQNFLQPLWTFVTCGCHPNRETWITITQAGFSQVHLEHYSHPEWGPVGPHIAGTAIK